MRILIDYRPALRERSGVGEYVHQLARALAAPGGDHVDIFTSSWKDRPAAHDLAELGRVGVVDRRVPVRLLNRLWHRLERPPVERLTGRRYDVVHSPHPLLMPSSLAARVVTIHDLDFLDHPERTDAEIRRDYADLAGSHARRADAVIVPSHHVAGLVSARLAVPADRLFVCPHGAPAWRDATRVPPGNPAGRYVLFLGTLEPRKNVPGLLEAYRQIVVGWPDVPPLVLAGRTTPAAAAWLATTTAPPLAGRVEFRGYVEASGREELFAGARVLVLPSFDEGFGLPVLEAMSLGIPVVASERGALPEVAGDAARLVDPDDPAAIARALEEVLRDQALACTLGERGRQRAAAFTWDRAATVTREAYGRAIERHRAQGRAR